MPPKKHTANKTPAKKAASKPVSSVLIPDKLAPLVIRLRRENVILDSDIAELYGVETKVLNQAVKRNIERFPSDFMFQLSEEEMEILMSQSVTLKRGEHRKYLPTPSQSRASPCFLPSSILSAPSRSTSPSYAPSSSSAP